MSNQKFPAKALNGFLMAAVSISLLATSGLTTSAYAYNESPGNGHTWLARKSMAFLKERRPDLAAKFVLDSYLPMMDQGNFYADNTNELACSWSTAGIKQWQTYACDALHHYGKLEVVESWAGVDIGHPGGFAAPDYVQALFDTAIRFWPSNDQPNLGQLPKKNAGYMTNGWNVDFTAISMLRPDVYMEGTDKLSLGSTYLGGVPYCEFVYGAANCPRWPNWAASDTAGKVATESVENGAEYLGWALHILQDLTVPYHAWNDATENHQNYERDIDQQIRNHQYEYLPALYGTTYASGGKVDVGNYFFFKDELGSPVYFTPKNLAGEARTYGGESSPPDRRLDAAIKLGASLLENYFDHVAMPAMPQYSYILHKYSGKYVVTGATTDGGGIHLWGPIPSGHEDRYAFMFIPTNDGSYYLYHKYSGKYVQSGTKNGDQLVISGSYIPAGMDGRYKFDLYPTSDGYYNLRNRLTQKYIATGFTDNGGAVHIWAEEELGLPPIPKGHEDRYKFQLVPPPPPLPTTALTEVKVQFRTTDENKDGDTLMQLLVSCNERMAATALGVGNGEFTENSTSPWINLNVDNTITKDTFPGDCRIKLVEATRGHDEWHFTWKLSLGFRDGTTKTYDLGGGNVDYDRTTIEKSLKAAAF